MPAATSSRVTTDHKEILRWASARRGKPALTPRPEAAEEDSPICIRFFSDEDTNFTTWKQWFAKFEKLQLALLYQECDAGGEASTFHKLVSRESVHQVRHAVGGKGRSAFWKKAKEHGANSGSGSDGAASPVTSSRKVASPKNRKELLAPAEKGPETRSARPAQTLSRTGPRMAAVNRSPREMSKPARRKNANA